MTRKEAIASGARFYSSNKLCKAGHGAQRYVANGNCVECVNIAATQRQDTHRAEVRLASNKWKKSNRYSATRRTLIATATPSWLTPVHKLKIRCLAKEAKKTSEGTGVPHHVDHIVPLVSDIVCGLHVPWNLRVIPALENIQKRSHLIQELAV